MIQIKQEQELLEGYRKLRPESKRLIMATVLSAVTAEAKAKPKGDSVQAEAEGKNRV